MALGVFRVLPRFKISLFIHIGGFCVIFLLWAKIVLYLVLDGGAKGNFKMTRYTDKYGPNVQNILCQATRVVRGKIPAAVRKELMAAVKAGALGRLRKDGLKPEIFFHPDHKHGAIERQQREAQYAIECIANVVA